MSKRMLNNAFGHGLAEALDAEAMAQSVNAASEDMKEALRAFFKKEPPTFRGR
jgi:enoyl-CoA hydratase/carnithine racemase